MARRPFSGTGADLVVDESGVPLPGLDGEGNVVVSGRAYDAETGGTQVTDLQTIGGATITGGIIVPDQHGHIPRFLGPNNDTARLWLDFGLGAERIQTLATDFPERISSLEAGTGGTGGGTPDQPPATAVVFSSGFRSGAPATDVGNFRWRCDGTSDQTEINAAIQAVANEGGGAVQLLGTDFIISGSIVMRTGVAVRGEGYGTEVRAATNFQAGMFVLADQATHATYLGHMTINGLSREVHGVHYNNPVTAESQPGGLLYTADPATNPDSMHVVEHLFINQVGGASWAGHGMIIEGVGSRGGRYSNIRILSPSGCGVWIKNAVDSEFHMFDCGGAGGGGPTPATSNTAPVGHGFYVGQGDSCTFTNIKCWYSRGAGMYIRGIRGQYSACYTQDNHGPGFWLNFGKNSYAACHADSNGQGNGANSFPRSGWYIPSDTNSLVGCQSYDRGGQSWVQQYGFEYTGGCARSYIQGQTYGNAVASETGTPAGTTVRAIIADAAGK